jgi:hypothetical protein
MRASSASTPTDDRIFFCKRAKKKCEKKKKKKKKKKIFFFLFCEVSHDVGRLRTVVPAQQSKQIRRNDTHDY